VEKIKHLFSRLKNIIWTHKRISIVVLILLLIIGFIFFPRTPKPILTQTVSRGDVLKTVSVTGEISANKFVNLSFQTGGTLTYLGVKTGDTVKAYQTIANLDQRTVQKNLQIALANYAEQRNTFDATEQTYGDAKSQNANSDQMRRILEDNQYDLNKAVDSVELQDLVRQQSILYTPIAGIVTRADAVASGINITPATVFTVTDPNSLNFSMDVDEADIGNVKIGQNVNISLDAFPDTTLHLKVTGIDFVSHQTSSGGTAFTVKTSLPYNGGYRVGINGNADIIIDMRQNVLNISLSSVMDDNTVYLKTKGGYYIKRKITLGLQSDTQGEVTSGLSEGDIIAIDPGSVPQQNIRGK
jgi:RND family efflux transporter MFP subunit